MSFLRELRRRNVFRVGLAYLAVVWLLLQVADVVVPILRAPEWLLQALFFSALLGFPLALVLAWFYELTPQGIRAASEVDAVEPVRFMGRKVDFAIIGLLVIAVGFLVTDSYVSDKQAPSLPNAVAVDPNSVAVLPFLNIVGDEEGRIFSEGLAEDLINRLATVSGLRVSSRGDSFSLAPNSPSELVRRRLRVEYYIEGSIRLVGGTMRVVVQLIDSKEGIHVFSRSFDRSNADFFSLQDEITNLVVANLRVAIPELAGSAIETVFDDTDNLDVYRSYRAGMTALRQPPTEDSTIAALNAFGQALRIDPGFAAAHAGICITYVAAYRDRRSVTNIDEAEASCASALELNPNIDVVHVALGDLYLATGRYEDAEAAFERATGLNENSVAAQIGLGDVYAAQGRLAEAENTLMKAIDLRPGNWNSYYALAGFLYSNGRYEEATQAMRELVSLDTENFLGWRSLALTLMLSGRFTESASTFERALEIREDAVTYSNLGLLNIYLRDFSRAIAALEKAVTLNPDYHLAWSNLGEALSLAGRRDSADKSLKTAERLAEDRLGVNSTDANITMDLAWIKAMLGDFEIARELIERAREIAPEDPYVHYINAQILARAGDHPAAVSKLATAVEMGYPLALIAVDPNLQGLEGELGFRDLIANRAVRQ